MCDERARAHAPVSVGPSWAQVCISLPKAPPVDITSHFTCSGFVPGIQLIVERCALESHCLSTEPGAT
jgi:hypothetical protein